MVTPELISQVKEKFLHGQRRQEIKEDLIYEGYEEKDVDQAIAKIQHDAIKQLPGISWVYRHLEHFESKSSAASLRTTIILMAVCVAFLLLVAGALYLFFDPLGTGSNSRDVKRLSDETIIQNGLSAYFQKNNHYPNTLDELVPNTLSDIPRDPKTGAEYSYQPMYNMNNYKLCIAFEQQEEQCVSAAPVVSVIPVIPTETPVPSFIPQSAQSQPSYHAN